MVDASALEALIRAGVVGTTHVAFEDLTGSGDHWSGTIVAEAFEGKTRVEQHQLVYRALGALLDGPVHALTLRTHTPASWEKARAGGD